MNKEALGEFIRMKREEKGISQEELADGIVSVSTLSRIERGQRLPRRANLQQLLSRLGCSEVVINSIFDNDDFALNLIKYELRLAYMVGDYQKAGRLLFEFKSAYENASPANRQVYDTISALIEQKENKITDGEALVRLESALRLTYPKYSRGNLPKYLSYDEIIILNNIAIRLWRTGDREKAVEMLYHISDFYDSQNCDIEEALRTQPMILYNLSKYLGLMERYNDCIAICNKAIDIACETGRCPYLSQTYYNLACALLHRKQPGDYEASKYFLQLACYNSLATKKKDSYKLFADTYFEKFGTKIELF